MSQKVKTPKGVIITLAAGFGLGAITMAGIGSGLVTPKAFAQDTKVSVRPIGSTTTESLAELHNLDASFANLAEFVAPSVVSIKATKSRGVSESGARLGVTQGEGSGFIIRSDGYIMTNDHVAGGADKVKVTLKDGRELDGTVISAQDSDIAIVKVEATNLPAIQFADSSQLRIGQYCMAVGAPFGLENTVTFGHISALGRASQVPDMSLPLQGRYYADMIQTDASINMGNSGGPLFNIDGQVIGVNTAIFSPTGVSAGIGFAIPSNQAKFIGDMLIEKGKIVRAMIGIRPENLKEYQKKEKNISGGALVAGFPEGENISSPARKAGIKVGDVITKIGSTTINNELDLRNTMLIYAPGTTVPVELIRDGKIMKVDVKLEEYKAPTPPKAQRIPGFDDNMLKKFEGFDGDSQELFKRFRDGLPKELDTDEPRIRSGRAQLGVSVGTLTDSIRKENNIPSDVEGAYVSDVQPGSVAEKAGLKAGDVITELNGKKLSTSEDLINAMSGLKWGDTAKVKFSSFGKNSQATEERTVTFK